MTPEEIKARIDAIVERAEYAGRQDGISRATRSQRRSDEAREASDLSTRMTHQMVAALVEELTRG